MKKRIFWGLKRSELCGIYIFLKISAWEFYMDSGILLTHWDWNESLILECAISIQANPYDSGSCIPPCQLIYPNVYIKPQDGVVCIPYLQTRLVSDLSTAIYHILPYTIYCHLLSTAIFYLVVCRLTVTIFNKSMAFGRTLGTSDGFGEKFFSKF